VAPFLNVPTIVRQCCHKIFWEGKEVTDLFKSGSEDHVKQLKEAYDDDGKIRLSLADVKDCALLLKQYLCSLPVPLFSEEGKNDTAKITQALKMNNEDDMIDKIAELVEELPFYHKHILREVFRTLHELLKKKREKWFRS